MQIGEVASFQNGYAFKSKDFVQDGKYKIIKIKELKDGKVRFFNDSASVNVDDERIIEKYIVEKGDVLFALTGDPVNKNNPLSWVGRVSVYEDDQLAVLNQRVCKLVPKEGLNAKYIYYYFRAFKNFYALASIAKGSASQANISTKDIEAMEIALPSLNIQNKIVSVLDSIEEKINQNNKINKNLEQQAQAIFDDMFPDIFSLNTDATLQDLIVFANGKKRPKTIGNIPVYGGNGILAYTDKSNADNCVIIGRVGAYCGNTFLCLDKCWTSDNAIQAKNRTGSSPLFIYYLLRNASLSSRHIGTGQPLMTQGILNAIPIKYPVEEKISAFIETCSPIHKMISGNRQQNESLASIRDSMLPKLMSGEMDVSELNL